MVMPLTLTLAILVVNQQQLDYGSEYQNLSFHYSIPLYSKDEVALADDES